MPESVRAFFQQATEALNSKHYSKAEKLQREGLDLLRAQATEDPQISNELEKLAGIHYVQEKFALAAEEYEEVLKTRAKAVSENDPSVVQVLHWLAKSHFNQQNYEQAEAAFRRALSVAEVRDDSPARLGRCLYELGFLLYFVGRYPEAESYLLRALEIYETTYGLSHPETVEVLERIALTYSHCSEIGKDPEPYFRKAVEVVKPDGEMRQAYIENLCRFAEHIAECRRFEEADELFSQLLKCLDTSAQSDDTDSHWVVSSCVEYFQSRGKGDLVVHFAAENASWDAYGEIVRKKLEHAEQTLSEDDPEIGEALFSSGNNALFRGRYDEAEQLLRRALEAYTKTYGELSEPVVKALNRICVVSRVLKKLDEGERAIQRALEIVRQHFATSEVYPRTLENFALLKQSQAKIGEATELYEQSIEHYQRICGFPSYDTAEALYRQSGFYLRIGEFNLAEAPIRKATSVMDEIESLSNYERADYLSILAEVLQAKGLGSESVEIRKRAEETWQRAKEESEIED